MEAGAAAAVTNKEYFSRNLLKKTIFILLDSANGSKSSGVFKFNVDISEDEPESLFVAVFAGRRRDHLVLKPVNTFYDQDWRHSIRLVANCQFQDTPEQVYLFPNDLRTCSKESDPPCLFNLKTNKIMKELPLSHRKQWEPIAAAVRKHIYVLPTATGSYVNGHYHPAFEAYDPVLNEWICLPPSPISTLENHVLGYAVLKDKFILFRFASEFYSFNAESHKWKPVKPQQPPPPVLEGQGLVLFENDDYANCPGVIYSLSRSAEELSVFSYIDETTKLGDSDDQYDLSLGPVSLVKGFQLIRRSVDPDVDDEDWGSDYGSSGTIAKVHNNFLCVLQSAWKVNGMIIRIDDHDFASCSILKIFTCQLSPGDLLGVLHLRACIVLQRGENGQSCQEAEKG